MTTGNPRYASKTTVSPEKTKGEIETVLRRYGATEFMYGWKSGSGVIGFKIRSLPIRIIVPLPEVEEFRYYEQKTSYGGTRRRERTADAAQRAYEQAERQAWRALLLVVKAKLEAVESGITTIEQEFLAHVLLPGGNTLSDELVPRINEAVLTGDIRPMLPMLPSGQPA